MPDPFAPEPVKKARGRKTTEVVHARDLDLSQVQIGVWIWAGTRADEPYPCMCEQWIAVTGYSRCGRLCPDAGRTDTGHLPSTCCAVAPRGRPRIVLGPPLPVPPLPTLRRAKLRPPAPVTAADVLVATILGRR
jgi:hypothetical protein